MSNSDYSDIDAEIIDITPRLPQPQKPRRKRNLFRWVIVPMVLVLVLAAIRGIHVYVDSLWYGSLGFGSRFWYVLGLGWGLFAVFAVLTFAKFEGGSRLGERRAMAFALGSIPQNICG